MPKIRKTRKVIVKLCTDKEDKKGYSGNKSIKPKEKQSKSGIVIKVSADKEGKKGYNGSKDTNPEEKQFNSGTVKVRGDKEDKKGYSGSYKATKFFLFTTTNGKVVISNV